MSSASKFVEQGKSGYATTTWCNKRARLPTFNKESKMRMSTAPSPSTEMTAHKVHRVSKSRKDSHATIIMESAMSCHRVTLNAEIVPPRSNIRILKVPKGSNGQVGRHIYCFQTTLKATYTCPESAISRQ
jgi:hypothetical protein